MENQLKVLMEPAAQGGRKMNGLDQSGGDSVQDPTETEIEQPFRCAAGPTQMIAGDGAFYESDVESFIGDSKELTLHSVPYAVTSVLGSPNSGKSSLLNGLFGINYSFVDPSRGRNQAAKGIWLSRCIHPSLLVMDFEFSDVRDRPEDDVSFEKQSVLFALGVSDLLMVNMWLQDINRDQGGSVQLIRTLLEERAKLEPGRTKLLVVIHGYDDRPPFARLVEDVHAKVDKLWMLIHDRPGLLLSDYFEVSVVGLPDKSRSQDFEDKVSKWRVSFAKDVLAELKQDHVSAPGFALNAKGIWETIRQKKRLNLLAHKLVVSSIFCERILRDCLESLASNEDYLFLKKGVNNNPKDFCEKLCCVLDSVLTRFDKETGMYDADVRSKKRQELESDVLRQVENTCKDILLELHSKSLNEGKDLIANRLSKAEDPTVVIDDTVEMNLKKFIESSKGLSLKYPDLCEDHCKSLRREMFMFGQILAEGIKEREKREEAERQRDEAELKARDAQITAEKTKEEVNQEIERYKIEAEKLKEESNCEIERYKVEAENARVEANRARRETDQAKQETKSIAEISRQETEHLTQLVREQSERAKREIEIVKEGARNEIERMREREEREARRRAGQRQFGLLRAVVVVARIVVFKDPTVVVDLLEFALWHGPRPVLGSTSSLVDSC